MAYTKQTWVDEALDGENPQYTLRGANGEIVHDDISIMLKTPIVQPGSPVNADRMNHIEGGIEAAHIAIDGIEIPFETNLANIMPDGASASVGTTDTVARSNHVHPDGDTAWIYPTLLNGWENYGAAYAPIRYRKIGKTVYIDGLMKNGITSTEVEIFLLDSEFRPSHKNVFGTFGANGLVRMSVAANGYVAGVSNLSASFTSLAGISFLIE